MKGVIRLELTYDLEPDVEKRRSIYGVTDPVACVDIDARNDLHDLLTFCDAAVVDVAVRP